MIPAHLVHKVIQSEIVLQKVILDHQLIDDIAILFAATIIRILRPMKTTRSKAVVKRLLREWATSRRIYFLMTVANAATSGAIFYFVVLGNESGGLI